MKRFFLTCFLLFSVLSGALATHLQGGEMSYKCLNDSTYVLTLKIYRFCGPGAAQLDASVAVGIFDGSSNLLFTYTIDNPTTVTLPVLPNPCQTTPSTACTQVGTYSDTILLPPRAGGYQIAFQRCCRPPGVNNVVNSGQQGNTYFTQIPDPGVVTCNSTPEFNTPPSLTVCANEALVADQSATDPDGDSLVYSLCDPYVGGSPMDPTPFPPAAPPYATVPWNAGFTGTNPITASPAFSIDPATGIMTGTPTQLGPFSLGICIQEYRNGVWIGESRREYQLEVVPCQLLFNAQIDPQLVPPNTSLNQFDCNGLSYNFVNLSTSSTTQPVTYFWDFGVPNLIDDTSRANSPSYTYPDTGVYVVMLIAQPGFACSDTAYDTIGVYEQVTASFMSPNMQCAEDNSFDFVALGTYRPNATITWDFGPNATPSTANTDSVFDVRFSGSFAHVVELTIQEEYCGDNHIDTVRLWPNPEANFVDNPQSGCAPLEANFINSSTGIQPMFYLWDFGDGAFSSAVNPSHVYQNPGLYDVSLTTWTDSACIDTSFVSRQDFVSVNPSPVSVFDVTPDSASIFEPLFTYTNLSDNITNCRLFLGNGESSDNCNITYSYSDAGVYAPFQVVTNSFGCVDTAFLSIEVVPEFTIFFPDAFSPNGDDLNEIFRPKLLPVPEYEFLIFNRWGDLIFETNDPMNGWDGTLNGREAPIGVYVYKINLKSFFGQEFRYFGDFTLVR